MREGLLPNNATHMLRLAAPEKIARAICDVLTETLDPEEIAASAFEIEPDGTSGRHALPTSQDWLVEIFFAHAPDETQIKHLIALVAPESFLTQLQFSQLRQEDWVNKAFEGLALVNAGRFQIYGAHARAQKHINKIGLEIEAALAFGTGHHGTTRGCLVLFDALLKHTRPQRICDIGTGTGVLAIAAARALKQNIAAGDLDAIAVHTARRNAFANQAASFVRPVVARGLQNPLLQKGAPYDLIFANILAKPLRLLAPSIARATTPAGFLILSGLLEHDVAGIVNAYRLQNFVLRAKVLQEGWASLLMQKGAPHQTRPCTLNMPMQLTR